MDKEAEVIQWARKMGYNGKIPPNMKHSVNSSTAHIWDQIMSTFRPRQEVVRMRNNLIIRRLQKMESSTKRMGDEYPIREIEVWKRKRELEKTKEQLEDSITKTEAELNKSTLESNQKYIMLENSKQKLREYQRYIFLLDEKSQLFETEITRVNEMLQTVTNLTPVELSDQQEDSKILNTLKECARKLETLQDSVPNPICSISLNATSRTPCSKRTAPRPLFLSTRKPECNSTASATSAVDLSLPRDELDPPLKHLLYNNERLSIWHNLHELIKKGKQELSAFLTADLATTNNGRAEPIKRKVEVAKLCAVHVENSLKIRQVEVKTQQLRVMLEKMDTKKVQGAEKVVSLMKEDAGLTAELLAADKHLKQLRSFRRGNELCLIQQKMATVEDNIVSLMRKIQDNLAKLHHTHVLITESRNSTASMVRKLNRFAQDTAWAGPLNDCIYSQEIQSFFSFPLEYNGRNGTPLDYFPYQETLDSKTALFIATCLRNPYSSAECILLDIVRAKATNARLRALRRVPCEPSANFYSVEELERNEAQIRYALEKLGSVMHCKEAAKTLGISREIKEVLKMWVEMPVREYVSSKRLYGGFGYKHYEKMYDTYYNAQ